MEVLSCEFIRKTAKNGLNVCLSQVSALEHVRFNQVLLYSKSK